jgi:hypothetical protein
MLEEEKKVLKSLLGTHSLTIVFYLMRQQVQKLLIDANNVNNAEVLARTYERDIDMLNQCLELIKRI